jgi:hypothetical protein
MIGGDVKIYAQYAYQARLAHSENTTIYQKFYSDRDPRRAIEYPPLAIEILTLMSVPISANVAFDQFYASFNRIFHFILLSSDILMLLVGVVYLLKSKCEIAAILIAVTTYTCSGFVLGEFLYSRLDLLFGELIALAVLLTTYLGRGPLLPAVVLSCAIAFKVFPIILAPVHLIGTFTCVSLRRPAILAELLKRTVVLGTVISVPWILFALQLGRDSLSFLEVHQIRGVHIESLWGTIAILSSKLGLPVMVMAFRSYDLVFSVAAMFKLLSWMSLLGGCMLVLSIYAVKAFPLLARGGVRSRSIAQEDPNLFKLAILTATVLSLAVSNVLSPQYLLWLLPLTLLIPWEFWWGKLSHLMLLALAFLTTLIVPVFYMSDVLRLTWWGTVLLSLRNGGILIWAVLLLIQMIRYPWPCKNMPIAEPN